MSTRCSFTTRLFAVAAIIVAGADGGEAAAQCYQSEDQIMLPLDGAAGDEFGFSIAVSGDVAIVGAPYADLPPNITDAGAAYIFRFDGSEWVEEIKVTAELDADVQDHFGWSVAIEGDVAIVGTPGDDTAASEAGAAYVFRYSGST